MTYKTIGAVAIAALLASPVFADGGPLPEPIPEPEPMPEPVPEPEPAPAPEPAGGFYVSLGGGAVWLPDMDIFTPFGDELPLAQSLTPSPEIIVIVVPQGVVGDSVADADSPGWAVVGAVGYDYGNGIRAELEVGYRRNTGTIYDAFEGFAESDFSINALDIMANVYYDFNLDSFFRPYVGAGVGVADVKLDIDTEGDDSDWAFAYQFIGGFSVPFPNTSIALFADYRYLATADLSMHFDRDREHDDYRSHTVLGGIRYNF